MINRGTYYQAGLIIRKGSFEEMQSAGLESFREIVRRIAPYLGDRVEEIKDWNQIKLLSVRINRLRQWYRPGLLCIGDAAHAMSPVGGVGINLAVQDAVAAARLLAEPLQERRVTEADLASVQMRREFPTRVTQGLQALAHKNFELISRNPGPAKAPWQLKVAVQIPGIQRVMGRVIGVGVRPEHVKAASAPACRANRVKKIAVGIGAAAAAFAFTLFETRQRPARTA
jgi:2-polyprenyl-6-methoxyphenol hydroxylase-like FAD-dependent oxidoreductase